MIRKYNPEDVDSVIAIWRRASETAHPFLSKEFMKKEEQLIRYIYLDEADTWVFEDGNSIEGFIAMVGHDVGGLFVDPSAQRKGIGGRLLDFVKVGRDFLTVDVFKENPIGCAFYIKYGFVKMGEIIHEETGNMLYRMRYSIEQHEDK